MRRRVAQDGYNERQENYLRDEYVSLRSEISARSGTQQQLLGLQISGAGILGGLAVQGVGSVDILLILPLFSLALTLLYLDHHLQIGMIGAYLRTSGERRMGDLPFYVHHRDRDRETEVRKRWKVSLWFIFAGSSAAGLLLTGSSIYMRASEGASTSLVGPVAAWSVGLLALGATCWQLAIALDASRERVKGA